MQIGLISSSLFALNTYLKCATGDICEHQPKTVASPPIITEQVAVIEIPVQTFDPLKDAKLRSIPAEKKLHVPFTSQAPHKNWKTPYDEACEEASLVMVEYYIKGESLTPEIADEEIKNLLAVVEEKDYEVDISAQQMANIAKETYNRNYMIYKGSEVNNANLKSLISAGYPIILPVAGQDLDNPNFRGDGPPYHVIVLTGYDQENFLAHDPGTQFGEHYKYPQDIIEQSTHDWSGSRSTVNEGQKAMLVLEDTKKNNYVAAYSF